MAPYPENGLKLGNPTATLLGGVVAITITLSVVLADFISGSPLSRTAIYLEVQSAIREWHESPFIGPAAAVHTVCLIFLAPFAMIVGLLRGLGLWRSEQKIDFQRKQWGLRANVFLGILFTLAGLGFIFVPAFWPLDSGYRIGLLIPYVMSGWVGVFFEVVRTWFATYVIAFGLAWITYLLFAGPNALTE
jgi:hypothetical protein